MQVRSQPAKDRGGGQRNMDWLFGDYDRRRAKRDEAELSLSDQALEAFDIAKRVIRTVFFAALFLGICKLTHFREKMLHDVRINRTYLTMFYACCGFFLMCYFYMFVTLRACRRKNPVPVDKWDIVAPIPMYSAAASLFLAVVTFIFALWPCFRFFTIVIGTSGFLAMIFVLSWIPI